MNLSEIFLADGTISPVLILWAFYIAVVIATVVYYLTTAQLGKIVTKLLEKDATTPESALNIAQMEIKPSVLTRICLRSPFNYKNLLVAITPDEKFYANTHYTDEPPVFKQLTAITRKRKSRIEEKAAKDDVFEPIDAISENIDDNSLATENAVEHDYLTTTKPEKINFNPLTAKYYIPKEVHPRANGIFKSSKTNVLLLIGALIGLGVIIYFSSFILDGLIDSVSSLFE